MPNFADCKSNQVICMRENGAADPIRAAARGPQRPRLASAIRLALSASTAVVFAPMSHAASITVTTPGDAVGTASTCTLRQAIASANADDKGVSNCVSGNGADTITFASGISQVTLAIGELQLTDISRTKIRGGASGVTIDGDSLGRVFKVISNAKAGFYDLTIQHGLISHSAGAGVACYGCDLRISDSTIAHNSASYGQAAALFSSLGSVSLMNCTVSDNDAAYPGAIVSSGALTIDHSTLSGNTAGTNGGAIYQTAAAAQLTVSNSTLSGNKASGGGGALSVFAGNLTLTNSTISGNTALRGGGLYAKAGTQTIVNSTFASNSAGGAAEGAAIRASVGSSLQVTNTLLAEQTLGLNCFGPVIDGGGNLEDSSSCGFGMSSFSNANGALEPLADNGGNTFTQMPAAGNAGVDAIDCSNAPATDQRDVPRPQGPQCDIGAVEVQPVLSLGVSDNSQFARYGKTVQFVVTLQNSSELATASNVQVSGLGSAAFNNASTLWMCESSGSCTTTPSVGPLSDTVTVLPGQTLFWDVSVPVYPTTSAGTATYTVNATGAATASDTDTLAIFEDGFNGP